MEEKVVKILEANRVMAISTLRPDGWPQTTMVGFAHEDTLIYFAVSRTSQKYANIRRDNRVSIAMGRDFHDPRAILGLSIAAYASDVTDPGQRRGALRLLLSRHPGLEQLDPASLDEAAVLRAAPSIITIIDYSKGFGHSDLLTVGPGGMVAMTAARDDDWGFGEALKDL